MIGLGLTGSIATGKSTVLDAFADLGVPTFSADAAVHRLYEGAAVGPVGEAFPGSVIGQRIDRAALSAILAQDPARIRDLEAIVHPLVRAEIAAFLKEAEKAGAKLAVVEVPLLFESGYDYGFDATAVTFCDPQVQKARALARPGMTVEKLDAILSRQMPQAEKRAKADYSFDTGDDIALTRQQVAALVAKLKSKG